MAEKYSNPLLTVDIIVELADATIVLIERKNPPHGHTHESNTRTFAQFPFISATNWLCVGSS